jgi:hypothetical protein
MSARAFGVEAEDVAGRVAEARAGKHGEAVGGLRDHRAPLGRADVTGMAREEPVMPGKIFHSVLEFPVCGFVEFFDDFCTGGF